MKADAALSPGTRGNCLFHAQTARGEAVIFDRQGHAQDAMVVMVWENGRDPIERRFSRWGYEAGIINAWMLDRVLGERSA